MTSPDAQGQCEPAFEPLRAAIADIVAAGSEIGVALGYAMNQGRAGWQHKHVRHLIDLVYAAL